ncbi:hypothetical protein E2C01_094540 [Portunus trituberculatus]|uniref:Uncharacterized protein n=1 Tax=Portunus trituberculatus TaxID=210409 RepID=A0A5B7K3G0_PORTR|nr:hypothetical protein [Portunus trituberculatus]
MIVHDEAVTSYGHAGTDSAPQKSRWKLMVANKDKAELRVTLLYRYTVPAARDTSSRPIDSIGSIYKRGNSDSTHTLIHLLDTMVHKRRVEALILLRNVHVQLTPHLTSLRFP